MTAAARLRRAALAATAGLAAAAAAFTALGGFGSATGPSVPAVDRAGPEPGLAVFLRAGCGDCHRLAAAGSRGGIGPDLDRIAARHTRESLIAAIVDPGAGLSPGSFSAMPDDYGERLGAAELERLADLLLAGAEAR